MTDYEKMTKAELIEALKLQESLYDQLAQSKVQHELTEPAVQWTVKTVSPGGDPGNPDFITLKYASFEEALQKHHEHKATLAMMGYKWLGGSRQSASGSASSDQGLKEDEMYIAKYSLEKQTDGRLKLQLFGTFDDGGLHKYYDIQLTADEADVWDALRSVNVDDSVHPILPISEDCKWIATYKKGRPKQRGSGHYLDLIKIREA